MSGSIDEINKTVAELKGRVDEVSARQNKPSDKSLIDILSSLSPLLSGVLIAAVGTGATIWYSYKQMDINHLDALDKYRPYVTSTNPVERVFGYRAFTELGEEDFVVELISADNDSAGISVLAEIVQKGDDKLVLKAESAANEIMAEAISTKQKEVPKPIFVPERISTKEAWAYLGHYIKSSNKWKTRYFEFDPDIKPDSLKGEWLQVREQTGDLNIRVGMPTATGQFMKVVDVLKPGSEARILEIEEWYSTGYMWAKIAYGTEPG